MLNNFVKAIAIILIPYVCWASAFDDKFNEFSKNLGIDIVNKKAPEFNLPSLGDENIKLSDYKGKIIFVNVWSVFCGPCRSGMPALNKLYNKFKENDFVLLGVSLDGNNIEEVKKYTSSEKISFPIMIDKMGDVASQYGVDATPMTYVINKEGFVLGLFQGTRDWFSDSIFNFIHFLLNSQSSQLTEVKGDEVKVNNIEQNDNENGIRINAYLFGTLFVLIFGGLTLFVIIFFIREGKKS